MISFSKINKTYIIAEIGVNHNNNMNLAKKMITSCKNLGANAVKFQTFKADTLALKNTNKVPYQKNNNKNENHYQMLKKLELSEKNHKLLFKFCKKKKIDFISTPYDLESANFLNKLGVKIFKVASADITDLDLHKFLSKTNKPVIVSTGMSTFKEIDKIVKIYKSTKNLALLHCVSNYPCKFSSINLNCLMLFKKKYKNITIGYSDHSKNSLAASLSIALKAKIIEKHVTYNKKAKGPDHKASADFNDFKNLILDIRDTEKILGKSEKKIQKEEMKMLKISRKSFFYKSNFKRGYKINLNDLLLIRPNKGILPYQLNEVLNKRLKVEVRSLAPVKLNHFENKNLK